MEGNSFIFLVVLQQALLALSLYIPLMGGQLSLASPAFFAIGGYIAAIASAYITEGWWPLAEDQLYPFGFFLVEVVISSVLCYGLAYAIGRMVLRLRGIYLALATLALVEIVRVLCLNLSWTGGAIGIFSIPQLFAEQGDYLWVFVPLFAVALASVLLLERSRLGQALRAIREDEYAAAAMGIDRARCKTLAFAWGAVLAGITGVASAHLLNTWNARQGTYESAINTLAYVMIGGSWSAVGASLGAGLLAALPEWLRPLQDLRLIVNGSLIVLATLFLPRGLIQESWFRRRFRGLKSRELTPLSGTKSPRTDEILLEVEALTVQFGGLRAVDKLSFQLKRGEILGLIGPNGAGKTTVFNALTGFVPLHEGHISWAGKAIEHLPIHERVHLGLARTFQNLRLLRQQSVLENVLAAASALRKHEDASEMLYDFADEAFTYVKLCGLEDKIDQLSGTLSYGDQRRLELARALMLRPQVILLDEPVAGMNPFEKKGMQELIRDLRDRLGLSFVLIEHHVPLVMGLCDRIAVLNFGVLIAQGTPAEVSQNPDVETAYLGKKEATP